MNSDATDKELCVKEQGDNERCKCEYCKTKITWGGADDARGQIWSCEKCGHYFCQACFTEKHGADIAHEMFSSEGHVKDINCPTCFSDTLAEVMKDIEDRICRQCKSSVYTSDLIPRYLYQCKVCDMDMLGFETEIREPLKVEGEKDESGFISLGYGDGYCGYCGNETYNVPTNHPSLCAYCYAELFPCATCDMNSDGDCTWSNDELRCTRFNHTATWKRMEREKARNILSNRLLTIANKLNQPNTSKVKPQRSVLQNELVNLIQGIKAIDKNLLGTASVPLCEIVHQLKTWAASEIKEGCQVERDSTMFAIYRKPNGDWGWTWVDENDAPQLHLILDPYHVRFHAEELTCGSYPYTYDKILIARLFAEANTVYNDNAKRHAMALANLMEEGLCEFTQKEVDFIFWHEFPLAKLKEMVGSLTLACDNYDNYYNTELFGEAVSSIKGHISATLASIDLYSKAPTSPASILYSYAEDMIPRPCVVTQTEPKIRPNHPIKILTSFGTLVAEVASNPEYPGIAIYLETDGDEGPRVKDMVLVEVTPNYPDEGAKSLRALVWADADVEDHTHSFTLGTVSTAQDKPLSRLKPGDKAYVVTSDYQNQGKYDNTIEVEVEACGTMYISCILRPPVQKEDEPRRCYHDAPPAHLRFDISTGKYVGGDSDAVYSMTGKNVTPQRSALYANRDDVLTDYSKV